MSPPPSQLAPRPTALPATSAPRFPLGRIAFAAVLLIIICAVAGFVPRWHQRTTLRAETRDLAIPTVSVVSPSIGKAAAAMALTAEVRPFVEAPIYARASGYLKHWLVDIGAQVQAGQLLAEIDTPELDQELAHARAELTQTEAALTLAKTTAERWAGLIKSSSVSQQEVAEKDADLAFKAATVEAARASVRRLEDLQSFSHVTAPFAGVITARRTDIGQLVAAGSTKELFLLAQTATLRVYVHVPQTAARNIQVGQAAELVIPELPGRVFPAKVVRTSGAMTAESRTLLTELQVENPQGEILAGSYAQVRFTETKMTGPLTLPSNSLLFRAEGPQVGIVGADNKVELRTISLGRDYGQTMEVLAGVTPSDHVILNPADSLVSGATVRIAAAKAESQ
jgi:membrane fusion protein (multidrug efflux system)